MNITDIKPKDFAYLSLGPLFPTRSEAQECFYEQFIDCLTETLSREHNWSEARIREDALIPYFETKDGYCGCVVCGQHKANWHAAYLHQPTGKVVMVGKDCAKSLNLAKARGWDKVRDTYKKNAERTHQKRALRVFLPAVNMQLAVDIMDGAESPHWGVNWHYRVVKDIIGKRVDNGAISENQWLLVQRLVAEIPVKLEEAQRLDAERQSEWGAAEDCPTGRIEMTGEIVHTKRVAGLYGRQLKMIVKDDRGFKVYMSIPSSICADQYIGKRVSLTATVTPSDKDQKFGFGKRPSKAKLL